MILAPRRVKFLHRRFLTGASAGVVLAMLAAYLILPLFQPVLAEDQKAASPESLCMTTYECGGEPMQKSGSDLCDKEGPGCCLGDRCFVRQTSFCAPAAGGNASAVLGFCYARSGQMALSVNIGGRSTVIDLADYLNLLYKYGIAVAGILAAVMMMIGGFQYLTAADSDRVSKGKERITNAITGLVVLFTAWLLLNTINPDLVSLRLPKIPVIKRRAFVGCQVTDMCAACGQKYGIKRCTDPDCMKNGGGELPNVGAVFNGKPCSGKYIYNEALSQQLGDNDGLANQSGVIAWCNGLSCGLANPKDNTCTDFSTRCRRPKNSTDTSSCLPKLAAAKPAATESGDQVATDQASFSCFRCGADGAPCANPADGPNDACCGGYCYSKKCSAGMPGDNCSKSEGEKKDDECRSGICQSDYGNSCSTGAVGSPCDAHGDCKAGFICKGMATLGNNWSNNCGPLIIGAPCERDDECPAGSTCLDSDETGIKNEPNDADGLCYDTNNPLKRCGSKTDCPSNMLCVEGLCLSGEPGSYCVANGDCRSGHCIEVADVEVCGDGMEGSRCDGDEDCFGGYKCYDGGDVDLCVSGGPNSRCDPKGDDCKKGLTCSFLMKRCMWATAK